MFNVCLFSFMYVQLKYKTHPKINIYLCVSLRMILDFTLDLFFFILLTLFVYADTVLDEFEISATQSSSSPFQPGNPSVTILLQSACHSRSFVETLDQLRKQSLYYWLRKCNQQSGIMNMLKYMFVQCLLFECASYSNRL